MEPGARPSGQETFGHGVNNANDWIGVSRKRGIVHAGNVVLCTPLVLCYDSVMTTKKHDHNNTVSLL